MFCTHNHVLVPYCSSDLWLGNDSREGEREREGERGEEGVMGVRLLRSSFYFS